MNDFSELEAELKKLRPAAPSADLMDRIEIALAEPESSTPSAGVLPKPRRSRVNWYGLGLGLAAAATFLVVARMDLDRVVRPAPAMASVSPNLAPVFKDEFVPADATRVVYNRSDEGLQYLGNNPEPVRRIRSSGTESMQWQNPKTGASLRVSYPREEIAYVPVSGQ